MADSDRAIVDFLPCPGRTSFLESSVPPSPVFGILPGDAELYVSAVSPAPSCPTLPRRRGDTLFAKVRAILQLVESPLNFEELPMPLTEPQSATSAQEPITVHAVVCWRKVGNGCQRKKARDLACSLGAGLIDSNALS